MSSSPAVHTKVDDMFYALNCTEIPGCMEIVSHVRSDGRGRFVKTFHAPWFAAQGLRTDFVEQYYSVSRRRVLRGMHFQKPPAEHAKLVYCLEGLVLDAVVDLRPASATFGKHVVRELSPESGNMLYVPEGFAHGFLVLSNSATLVYSVTSVYTPECDSGFHWQSAGIPWPDASPTVSNRDQHLPPLEAVADSFRGFDR